LAVPTIRSLLVATAAIGLSACDRSGEAQVERALQDLNVVDETNLNEVMLTIGDPDEAVNYFAGANANDPGRVDLQRGLAKSLIRAKRASEAAAAWKNVVAHKYTEAERLFNDALRNDTGMFTAKNNLIMARGAQRNYDLPVIPMTQTERAQLLHTLALTAIKQNDVTTGKGLLREAIDTHPQHFEEAVRSLRALEDNVTN